MRTWSRHLPWAPERGGEKGRDGGMAHITDVMLYSTEHGLISSLAKSRTSHHYGTRFNLLGHLKKRVSLSPKFANLQSWRGNTHSPHISNRSLKANVIGKLTVALFIHSVSHLWGWAPWLYSSCLSGNKLNRFFDFPISDVFKYHLSRLRGNHDYGKSRSGMWRNVGGVQVCVLGGTHLWTGGRLWLHSVIGSRAFQGLNVTLAKSCFSKLGQSHASNKSCQEQTGMEGFQMQKVFYFLSLLIIYPLFPPFHLNIIVFISQTPSHFYYQIQFHTCYLRPNY